MISGKKWDMWDFKFKEIKIDARAKQDVHFMLGAGNISLRCV